MRWSQTKVSVLHVASGPSALRRPGQRLSGLHRKGKWEGCKATTTKGSALLYVCVTLETETTLCELNDLSSSFDKQIQYQKLDILNKKNVNNR